MPFIVRQMDGAGAQFERLTVLRRLSRSLLLLAVIYAIGGLILALALGLHRAFGIGLYGLSYGGFLLIFALSFLGLLRFGAISSRTSLLLIACMFGFAGFMSTFGIITLADRERPWSVFLLFLGLQTATLMIIIEVLACVLTLFFAGKWQRDLFREPITATAFVDAPPATQVISRGRFGVLVLFVVSAATSSVAAFLIVLPLIQLGPAVMQLSAYPISGCGDSVRECLLGNVFQFGVGLPFFEFVSAFFLALFARWVASIARYLARKNAAEAMHLDARPPTVFLRAFRDDQVELPQPRRTPLRLFFGALRGRSPLDHLLIEEFANYGPVVAIGRPGEKMPPFGAWRTYVDNTDSERWKTEVAELTDRAGAIVLVIDDTAGVSWEVEHLSNRGHLAKTILCAPPRLRAAEANSALWAGVAIKVGIDFSSDSAPFQNQILAVFGSSQKNMRIACSRRFTRSEYSMALRWFFRERNA